MAEQQEKLSEAIKRLSFDIECLSGYAQNDFESLLSEGYTTKAEIAEAAKRAAESFDRCSSRLLNLRTQVLALMAKHSAPSSEEP